VTRVWRYDRGVAHHGVSRHGKIEVVYALAAMVQFRFEVTEAPAYLVGPFCSSHRCEQDDEAAPQLSLSPRGRQAREAVTYLCYGRLR
jgi:hypothetical protein